MRRSRPIRPVLLAGRSRLGLTGSIDVASLRVEIARTLPGMHSRSPSIPAF